MLEKYLIFQGITQKSFGWNFSLQPGIDAELGFLLRVVIPLILGQTLINLPSGKPNRWLEQKDFPMLESLRNGGFNRLNHFASSKRQGKLSLRKLGQSEPNSALILIKVSSSKPPTTKRFNPSRAATAFELPPPNPASWGILLLISILIPKSRLVCFLQTLTALAARFCSPFRFSATGQKQESSPSLSVLSNETKSCNSIFAMTETIS